MNKQQEVSAWVDLIQVWGMGHILADYAHIGYILRLVMTFTDVCVCVCVCACVRVRVW